MGSPAKELNLRVMLVVGTFPPGQCGIGDYVARLAQSLAAEPGVRVAVLAQQGAHANPASHVEVFAVARRWALAEWPALRGALRAWRPDVVHIHYPSQGFYGRVIPALLPLACRLMGLRVVQTWHEAWPLRAAPRVLLQRLGAHGLLFVRPNFPALLSPALRPLLRGVAQDTIPSAGALPVSAQTPEQARALRDRLLAGRRRLVVFFGFLYPSKGVEQLFEIADPACDALVIAGAAKDPAYLRRLQQAAQARRWPQAHVHYAGFLAEDRAADLLAAADAVVLPFLTGAGDWNTSVHAALAQGTPVITTAAHPTGHDAARNLYTARISDIGEMRRALGELAGRRTAPVSMERAWARIALGHLAFYRALRGAEPRTSSQ